LKVVGVLAGGGLLGKELKGDAAKVAVAGMLRAASAAHPRATTEAPCSRNTSAHTCRARAFAHLTLKGDN